MSFDVKCHELASAFMSDYPSLSTPERINKVAQAIQDAIEEEITDFETEAASLGDCVSCDGYVLNQADTPYCPTCARLLREGKPL